MSGWVQVFVERGRRKVGGGPKTMPADEILWAGLIDGREIVVRSTVRLLDPYESFRTSSNMRLRDSFVGDGGHWVDMVVLGDPSDTDLRVIETLAREADPRPVRVRRRGEPMRRPALPLA